MTAWEVLWRCGISELPVDLGQVCRRLGLGLYSYTQGYELLRRYNLAQHVHGADGFLFREEDGPLAAIFYRPEQSQGRRCFTIAHEIGHFALGHRRRGQHSAPLGGGQGQPPRARGRPIRLPAPGPLLRPAGPGPAHPFAIGQRCRLSLRAAEVCASRMERLLELDAQYMAERGRSYFFRSPGSGGSISSLSPLSVLQLLVIQVWHDINDLAQRLHLLLGVRPLDGLAVAAQDNRIYQLVLALRSGGGLFFLPVRRYSTVVPKTSAILERYLEYEADFLRRRLLAVSSDTPTSLANSCCSIGILSSKSKMRSTVSMGHTSQT